MPVFGERKYIIALYFCAYKYTKWRFISINVCTNNNPKINWELKTTTFLKLYLVLFNYQIFGRERHLYLLFGLHFFVDVYFNATLTH